MTPVRTFEAAPLPKRNTLGVLALLWGLGLLLGARLLLTRPFDLTTYGLGLLWGLLFLAWVLFTYRLWALSRLTYWVDRNGLYVRWGWSTFVFPMTAMDTVHEPGLPVPVRGRWWDWPARYVGTWQWGDKRLHLYSTLPPERAWFLCGPQACLGISPREGKALVEALNRRRRLGPTRLLSEGRVYPRWLRARFWQDSPALAFLAAGLLLLLLLWGEVAARPAIAPVHRTARVATLILGGDWLLGARLYRRERVLALTLWGAGAMLLAVLLIHLWTGS